MASVVLFLRLYALLTELPRGLRLDVSSTATFVLSFFGIVLIGIIFELLNKVQRSYDISIARRLALAGAVGRTADDSDLHIGTRERCGSLPTSRLTSCLPLNLFSASCTIPLIHRTVRALLYGITVFLSLFIMLIFMTYNVSRARRGYYAQSGRMI